jgi:hypothetical protein
MRYLDTLKKCKDLTDAGFNQNEAEAQIKFMSEMIEWDYEIVATKKSLEVLEIKMEAHFKYLGMLGVGLFASALGILFTLLSKG